VTRPGEEKSSILLAFAAIQTKQVWAKSKKPPLLTSGAFGERALPVALQMSLPAAFIRTIMLLMRVFARLSRKIQTQLNFSGFL
jgi:hypothetical protein